MQIVVSDILVNLEHQFADTAKRATSDCVLRDQSKPTLDLVEPARIGWGVMNVVAPMARQPGSDPWMFVRGVVVGD